MTRLPCRVCGKGLRAVWRGALGGWAPAQQSGRWNSTSLARLVVSNAGPGVGPAWRQGGSCRTPPHSQKCQELRWCPRGPQCFLGCRFAHAVLRWRLCPDPSTGDPEAPRSLTSPFPGGRGSQGEVIHGATEQKSGADGHSVSQAWVPWGPHAWSLPS